MPKKGGGWLSEKWNTAKKTLTETCGEVYKRREKDLSEAMKNYKTIESFVLDSDEYFNENPNKVVIMHDKIKDIYENQRNDTVCTGLGGSTFDNYITDFIRVVAISSVGHTTVSLFFILKHSLLTTSYVSREVYMSTNSPSLTALL